MILFFLCLFLRNIFLRFQLCILKFRLCLNKLVCGVLILIYFLYKVFLFYFFYLLVKFSFSSSVKIFEGFLIMYAFIFGNGSSSSIMSNIVFSVFSSDSDIFKLIFNFKNNFLENK